MASCVRGTCNREAVAGFRYDPVGRTLLLLDMPGDQDQVLALCGAHADNLTVPDGWVATDERTGEPRLWSLEPALAATKSANVPAARPAARLDHERAKRQTSFEELALFDIDLRETSDTAKTGGADTAAADARQALIPGAEDATVAEVLEVDSGTPLLARAFRASKVG